MVSGPVVSEAAGGNKREEHKGTLPVFRVENPGASIITRVVFQGDRLGHP